MKKCDHEPNFLEKEYRDRHSLLKAVAEGLDRETNDALLGMAHIDRIVFRVKQVDSFVAKACDPENRPSYERPLAEIEDQIAGRVIVFFFSDINVAREKLLRTFNPIEASIRRPRKDEEFGYESEHIICHIPPQVKPVGWDNLHDHPETFELQLRTVFMHAYAEPQHDVAYKASSELSPEIRRQLAWIAASAWGADQAYLRVMEQLGRPSRNPHVETKSVLPIRPVDSPSVENP